MTSPLRVISDEELAAMEKEQDQAPRSVKEMEFSVKLIKHQLIVALENHIEAHIKIIREKEEELKKLDSPSDVSSQEKIAELIKAKKESIVTERKEMKDLMEEKQKLEEERRMQERGEKNYVQYQNFAQIVTEYKRIRSELENLTQEKKLSDNQNRLLSAEKSGIKKELRLLLTEKSDVEKELGLVMAEKSGVEKDLRLLQQEIESTQKLNENQSQKIKQKAQENEKLLAEENEKNEKLRAQKHENEKLRTNNNRYLIVMIVVLAIFVPVCGFQVISKNELHVKDATLMVKNEDLMKKNEALMVTNKDLTMNNDELKEKIAEINQERKVKINEIAIENAECKMTLSKERTKLKNLKKEREEDEEKHREIAVKNKILNKRMGYIFCFLVIFIAIISIYFKIRNDYGYDSDGGSKSVKPPKRNQTSVSTVC